MEEEDKTETGAEIEVQDVEMMTDLRDAIETFLTNDEVEAEVVMIAPAGTTETSSPNKQKVAEALRRRRSRVSLLRT